MNNLLKVTYKGESPIISGRALHKFLEIETPYKKWFDRMAQKGFTENIDFTATDIFVQDGTAFGGQRKMVDHAIKIDVAKEIAMLQNSERGKQARQHFIEVEKQWNSPELIMARALKISHNKINELTAQIGELKPKAEYADKVLASPNTVTITQIAADYEMTGQQLNELLEVCKVQYKQNNQWILCVKHRGNGYTDSKTTHPPAGAGKAAIITRWTQEGRRFIYETLRKSGFNPKKGSLS